MVPSSAFRRVGKRLAAGGALSREPNVDVIACSRCSSGPEILREARRRFEVEKEIGCLVTV